MKLADDNNLPENNTKGAHSHSQQALTQLPNCILLRYMIEPLLGDTYTVKLRAFDTLQVQAKCLGHVPSLVSECLRDLTGSEILSDKPIHVFSGNIRAWVPDSSGKSRDHLIEQIMPRDRCTLPPLSV